MQAAADRQADDLARELGKALRLARKQRGLAQEPAAALAGLSQSEWSRLELGRDGRSSLATWNRVASALGTRLKAYLPELSAADLPRDAVHLRNQELVMRTSAQGGWRSLPEALLDVDARTSRAADVLLQRGPEYALCEVHDWFADVGAAAREWPRRLDALERRAIARMSSDELPRVSGLWVLRATLRNRQLVAEHRQFYGALLPGSGTAWLRALTRRDAPVPAQPALLWVSVDGRRLYPARIRV